MGTIREFHQILGKILTPWEEKGIVLIVLSAVLLVDSLILGRGFGFWDAAHWTFVTGVLGLVFMVSMVISYIGLSVFIWSRKQFQKERQP